MPLTKAGSKVLATMIDKHGSDKGEKIFYASINKGIAGSNKWHNKEKKKTNLTLADYKG